MDVEGPGAVVRFWATWHGPRGEQGPQEFSNGTLRFYLDNDPKPVIEGPIASILDGGGLCRDPLAQGVSPETEYGRRGHNLYLPIPYSRHCKITYETDVLVDPGGRRGEALYYQINYRTYDAGTPVECFSMKQIEDHQDKLDAVQTRLRRSAVEDLDEVNSIDLSGPLGAGQTRTKVIKRPGANWNVASDPETAALPVALVRSDVVEVFRVPNALEGEDLLKQEMIGGTLEIQDIPSHRWGKDRQIWWRDAKVGDRLVLSFNVPKTGRYEVQANLTKANDYAVVSVSVNNEPAQSFDQYHETVGHDLLNLGIVELPQGANRLCVEITNANEKAIKRHMYLQLNPQTSPYTP